MLSWKSLQALPQRLLELLDRAGARFQEWDNKDDMAAIIFLPPHLLLGCQELTSDTLSSSYQKLSIYSETNSRTLVNGERILCFSARELREWQVGMPLPRKSTLQPVNPWQAGMALSLLANNNEILGIYEVLDRRSEKGGSQSDNDYIERIQRSNPEDIINESKRIALDKEAAKKAEDAHFYIEKLQDEFEKLFLDSLQVFEENHLYKRQAEEIGKASIDQVSKIKQTENIVLRQGALLRKLMILQGRKKW